MMANADKQIWTRVPAGTHKMLKREAERNDLTLSAEVRYLVELGLGVYHPPLPPTPPSYEGSSRR